MKWEDKWPGREPPRHRPPEEQSTNSSSLNADQSRATRRFNRELRALLKHNDGCCTICRASFLHNGTTYVGATADGAAANVSDCCKSKLQWIHGFGVYLAKSFEEVQQTPVVNLAVERSRRELKSLPAREHEIYAKVMDRLRDTGLPTPDYIEILFHQAGSDDSIKADCARMARERDSSVLICNPEGKILAYTRGQSEKRWDC
jgi:hypothetical protein